MVDWNIWKEICKPSANHFITNENQTKVSVSIDDFDLPIQTKGVGEIELKFPSGTIFNVCPNSDFFTEIRGIGKQKYWNIMRIRYDCIFILNTKSANLARTGLPNSFSKDFPNVVIALAAENQEELSVLAQSTQVRHLWLNVKEIREEIKCDNIEYIYSSGDSTGKTITDFAWHSALAKKCKESGIGYSFLSTGKLLKIGDKIYNIPKEKQQEQALKAGINVSKIVDKKEYIGKPAEIGGMLWKVFNNILVPIDKNSREVRYDLLGKRNALIQQVGNALAQQI